MSDGGDHHRDPHDREVEDAEVDRYPAGYYDEAGRELLLSGAFRIVYTGYDWTLNSTEHASRVR